MPDQFTTLELFCFCLRRQEQRGGGGERRPIRGLGRSGRKRMASGAARGRGAAGACAACSSSCAGQRFWVFSWALLHQWMSAFYASRNVTILQRAFNNERCKHVLVSHSSSLAKPQKHF